MRDDKTSQGNLYVLAAPSGTGKTSLVKALTQTLPNLMVSISHTTRSKRANEKHGINYFFVMQEEFNTLIKQGEFLEYATIFGQQYGTAKKVVVNLLAQGMDVILEIDWQGHQQIKQLFPQSTSIFIMPPSLADLEKRLTLRNQDCPATIKDRIADAKETIAHAKEFDYLVVNDNFDHALNDLQIIIKAARLRRDRQLVQHADMISKFFKD